ncbi:MAG: tetratricopeptide repeat protein [Bryobacteraceae bacterium]
MPIATRIAITGLFVATLAFAQTTGTSPAPAPAPTPPTAPPTTGGGGGNPNNGGVIPQSAPSTTQQNQVPRIQQPVFITGNVTLADGTEPPERVLIERLCSANNVRSEGYTDSKGRFSLQLGQSLQLVPDASQSMLFDTTQGGFSNNNSNNSAGLGVDPYLACELRARLPGYRSSSIPLAGRRSLDNPAIGTLVLYPFSKTDGQAISATSAAASKDARKAFEKGLSEAKNQKPESAEKSLRKAVELHPKYAEAWVELSKLYLAAKRLPEARDAANHAVSADPQFVYPYEQLYRISFEEVKWQELADTTDRLLRLNPYEFPEAYYYNGVAHYQLKNYPAAEQSLQKAIDADRRNTQPKAHYVLGLVLVQKHDYQAAAQSLVTFANLSPNDAQIPKVKAILEQIEKALQ